MRRPSLLLVISLLACLAPCGTFAQDNSYAITLQNNAMWQANLTKQMINLGGTCSACGAPSPAACYPPYDLQRGFDGHVPPELQSDPRYQEYLRCKQGNPATPNPPAAAVPVMPTTHHLPITATDFVPAKPGHPTVDQTIRDMPMTPEQRHQLHNAVDEMFRRVAAQYRGNNLAVSVAVAYATSMTTLNGSQMNQQQSQEFILGINDQLAQSPKFALLTTQEKQDESDKLVFQGAIISMLRDDGAHDPQAKQQSMELSRFVMRQFDNEGRASTPPEAKVAIGVKVGNLIPAVAAAAGFEGTQGALVIAVKPGGAADRAGIKAGDILMRVGNEDIKTAVDVHKAIESVTPGKAITVRVFRHGARTDLDVVL